ncbi:Na+:solute symporter [Puniceicoccaceae bacterium K14]|nr:Na+:solute symporter [Puniceicoccaceae bacterium K14]
MPELSIYDYIVIAVYFMFMLSIGFITKRMITNTSDYFRGGGKMLWWMAGASAFMTQFSAWSFTGAASEAYKNGFIILTIFLANALGFAGNAFYFAPKFRQMRVVTPIQAVRQRYGSTSEQFFTWLQIPVGTLQAGIWLFGLAIFISSVFGFPLEPTIVVVGFIVTLNSLLGGSWAVVASDFMQTVILMLIAIVTAIFSLMDVGGPANLVAEFPAKHIILGNDYNYAGLIVAWMALMFVNQFCKTNQMIEASRYLNAKDSKNARKAALLSMTLFIVGPVLWFIPPMVSRVKYPDLTEVFPQLGEKATEAAYVAIALDTLPMGMIGLLVAGMFAATISSMDSGLNRNAGILVKNFYLAVVNKNATERSQMIVAKVLTVLLGCITVGAAIFYNSLKNFGLFDLMLTVGALISLPMAVPLILGIIIKKTPDWSAWSTALLGLCCSYMIKFHFNAAWYSETFDLGFTIREGAYFNVAQGVLVNVTIPTIFYLCTTFFYKEPSEKRKEVLDEYWDNLDTPVLSEDTAEEAESDAAQGSILGGLAGAYGTFVLLLCLVPNDMAGRTAFLLSGLALITLGGLLYKSTRPKGA